MVSATFAPTSTGNSITIAQGFDYGSSSNPALNVTGTSGGTAFEEAAFWDDAGVTIKQVLKDSPADKAGLKPGDRLLTLDGRWTDSQVDLFEAAAPIKPDTTRKIVTPVGGQAQPAVLLVSVPYALRAEEAVRIAGASASDLVRKGDLTDSVREAMQSIQSDGNAVGHPTPLASSGPTTFAGATTNQVLLVQQTSTGPMTSGARRS